MEWWFGGRVPRLPDKTTTPARRIVWSATGESTYPSSSRGDEPLSRGTSGEERKRGRRQPTKQETKQDTYSEHVAPGNGRQK